MFYKFDKKMLEFKKVNWLHYTLRALTVITLLVIVLGINMKFTSKSDFTESEIMVILNRHNQFTEEKLIEKLKSLNFKFPHIVLAQAKLETNNYTSKLFLENHNLFGMKEAIKRITTANGTQYEHAYYDNWMESVYDYAFYSSTYLSSINTENEYYEFLAQNYAEDTSYVQKIKQIVKNEELKSMFNVN